MKIYTRTGDRGETGLLDGSRVFKDHVRVTAYGEIDELNAVLGVTRAHSDPKLGALLHGIQKDLFALGAQLADPTAKVAAGKAKAAVTEDQVRQLEEAIDARESVLPPLRAFILPGGSALAAFLHLGRTVCRRAERTLVALGRLETVDPAVGQYVNRLSDLLFVLARHENHHRGEPEDAW